MRKSILVALALAPAVVWALTLDVSFRLPPQLNRIKPTAIVDEAGNVLFGTTPAKVEVTNAPPSNSGGAAVFTAYGTTECPPGFVPLYTGGVYLYYCNMGNVGDVCWQTAPSPAPPAPCSDVYQIGSCVVCKGS